MSSEAQKYRVQIGSFEELPALNRYWNDPEHRANLEAQQAVKQRRVYRDMDERMIASGIRWPSSWTEKEKYEATAHLRGMDQ